MLRSFLAVHVVGLALACVAGACGSSDPNSGTGGGGTAGAGGGSGGSAGGTSGGGSDGGHGSEITPSPNTPPSCEKGTTACHPFGAEDGQDPVCTDTQTDAYNCGGCDHECDLGPGAQSCVNGKCVGDGPCPGGVVCDGTCVEARTTNPSHCGGCDNRCGERELCSGAACVDTGGGTGLSCDSPLILPAGAAGGGFHFGGALTGTREFTCGPLKTLPTRWIRMTASDTGPQQVKLDAVDDTDGANVIAEVFDSPCPGDAGTGLACEAGTDGAEAQLVFQAVAGHTYVIAAGVTSGSPSALHISF